MRIRVRALAVAVLVGLGSLVAGRPADAESLADDGRVGVVTDLQGTALVRPAGRTRWSPLAPRSVLLPGDEVRTLARGPHAAEVSLADGGSLVVGPGALAVLEARGRVRLVDGDAEVTGTAARPIDVTGPGGFSARAEKATVVRAASGKAAALAEPPRWLTGWRSSTTDEWMGSLVAKVDGRDVPLTVGYHKVDVTIRDQVAETTVEQSFVNSTLATLEGVFSFPLPAGASISGFGMWVGDELVEADIVEKERARAIYEEIRSLRKDPGLLEWSGGNLFKASVFPIFGHSEKRIRLRYTQVLPLEGSLVRYRYALRSEMLRTHPLRELRIRVAVQSSAPLRSVTSPTHEVRVTQTANAAVADFSASEFRPGSDFEVAVGLAETSPLRAVAHRRGEDGYFMLLFAPPASSSDPWQRDLVPDGAPLDVLFLADTSGSMGPAERAAQRAFMESCLALLSEKDRFRILACDAKVVPLVEEPTVASPENAAKGLDLLDRRISLGWSDFDAAMASAIERAAPGTLVVYVGDGIGTTGDADPVALAQRIGRMKMPEGAAVHAVAVGSSYEQGVLEAMASLGGSFRNAGDDPSRAASSLLREVAQPSLRDVRVTFEGVRTARVHPEKLPNLPAGAQQVVLGRFLPERDADARGRAIVTGTLAGKPVSYSAEIVLSPGEEGTGNSFLPRLWARRQLDALLAEGRTPAIKAEIVSMSESYGIITPYTSFLVLENDEDRERYGVTRRVAMRDGEKFFTQARTTAATAVLREEMQKARSWRIGLRRAMLAEIADLGRRLPLAVHGLAMSLPSGGGGGGGGLGMGRRAGESGSGAYYGPHGELPAGRDGDWSIQTLSDARSDEDGDGNEESDAEGGESAKEAFDDELPPDTREPSDPPPAASPPPAREFAARKLNVRAEEVSHRGTGGPMTGNWRGDGRSVSYRGGQWWYGQQILQRFPALAGAPGRPPEPPETTYIVALLLSLAEPDAGTLVADARLELVWREGMTPFAADAFWPMTKARAYVSPSRWFVTSRTASLEPYDQWLDADRGILAAGTRLGRRRASVESDRLAWAPIVGRSVTDFARGYAAAKWTATISPRDGDVVVVTLTAPGDAKEQVLLTIDVERRLLTEQRTVRDGKVVSTARWTAHVRAGGLWWPTLYVVADAEGRETFRRELTVREIAAREFDAGMAAGLAGQEDAIFLGAADPAVPAAKQAVHEGRGSFADHLVIAADHAAWQRWDDAWAAWEKARALVDTKETPRSGADWVEASLLSVSRRGERFTAMLGEMAARIAARGGPAAHGLARLVDQLTQSGLHPNEQLTLLDVLGGATDTALEDGESAWQETYWKRRRAQTLVNSGRAAEGVAVWRALWKERPQDQQRAMELMNGLVQTGDVDGALELWRAVDLSGPVAKSWHAQQVLSQVTQVLWNANRFAQVLDVAEKWTSLRPDDSAAWQQRASALLALGRIEEFDRFVGDHLVAPADMRDATAMAQMQAAVELALGQDHFGRSYGGNTIDAKWVKPLAALARRLVREKDDRNLVGRVVSDWRWGRTDGQRELVAGIRADLAAEGTVETLPAQRLAQALSWVPWDRNSVDAAAWRALTDRVLARLAQAKEDADRRLLLPAVLALLDAHIEPDEAVRVLRAELAAASAERVPEVADLLLARLVRAPWSEAMENEAFALVPRLVANEKQPEMRRARLAAAARWLADRLLDVRVESLLPPQAEREKLPRAELRARQAAARRDARRGLGARLATELKSADDALRPWYGIERLCLAAEVGEEKDLEAQARELLLSLPSPTAEDVDGVDGQLTWVLRERCVLVLSYLATRPNAAEGLADRVLALVRERMDKDEKLLDWRYAAFRLLVALDRTKELEESLVQWIVPAQVESRWRRALGYVLAETGRVREAAERFEEVEKLGELSEPEFVTLANWYLVLGEDARREAALDRRYAGVEEWELSNRVGRERNRIQSRGRDGVPPTMDDEVLRVIRALFAKSTSPANHVWNVQSLYQETKDFRLLASLADGVVGHTPQATYPFLGSSWQVLQQVHEEATCDEVRARLAERLASAKTTTDRRALALLMVLVERRAAEVLNQPGPHAQRALDDLRRARQGEWQRGERRLMAEFLASMGRIPDAALAAEQLEQLAALHAAEAPGGEDRLRIAYALHRTQWAYDLRDAAIDGLVVALDERRLAAGGALPPETNDIADTLTDWHESVRRFAAGESWLAAEAARQTSPAQRQWYARRTFHLWMRCLENGGTVSLGSGETLYRAARDPMERALVDHAPDRVGEVVETYCALHRAAHKTARVKGVGDDLVRFSRTLLPEVLPRFGQQQGEQVRRVAETLNDVAGPLVALTFAVERVEAEPAWFARRAGGYGIWQQLGHRMADWRHDAGPLGDLEPRLLAVVLAELERDLTSEEARGRHLYHRHHHRFWAEKAGDFARVARKVIEENPQAPGRLRHTAQYLWDGLDLKDEAIATLEQADLRGALAEDGRYQLVQWHQVLKHWRESLPHAERLVAERPDNLEYHCVRLRALHGVGRDADGRTRFDEARAHFADLESRRRIGYGSMARLSDVALECEWFDRAADLYPTAISQHRRAGRGAVGDGETSRLWAGLARALAGMSKWDEAVDAASSAIVAWGPSSHQRGDALASLRDVLAKIPDLPAWTARHEEKAAATGLDAPVIRLSLASIHLERKEPDAALRHLVIARRLNPDDAEVHAAIVKAYGMKDDAAGIADALATSLHHLPAQIDLYERLAEAFLRLKRTDDAERAVTGLVEFAPNESEGHARLAALRTKSGRHDDAAAQWRQVVRIRSADMPGWLELARALARAGRKDEAHRALDEFLATPAGAGRRKAVEDVSREIEKR